MCNELTWEQEQDIAAYEQWQAEQAWESKLGRMIAEDERAEEAEQDSPIDEFDDCPDYDWKEHDTQDHEAAAAYYDHIASGLPSDELPY